MKNQLGFVLVLGLLLIAHAVLQHWMAEANVVSALFAAGGAGGAGKILLALAFVALRITVIILLPGLIAWRVAGIAVDARRRA